MNLGSVVSGGPRQGECNTSSAIHQTATILMVMWDIAARACTDIVHPV